MGRDSGALVTTVVALTVLMMISVSFVTVSSDVREEQRAAALSGAGDRVLTVGMVGYVWDIGTLNPLLFGTTGEYMTIWPCYSTLLALDVDGTLTGDLAASWTSSADGLTWDFRLVNHAYFYEGLTGQSTHQVTASDVIFTLNTCIDYETSMSGYLEDGLISSMTMSSPLDLRIQLNYQYAPFLWALTEIPILPEYIWAYHTWDWANYDTTMGIPPCVGSGPFCYTQPGLPTTGTVELRKNPTWFQTNNKGWNITVNRLIFRTETSADSAQMDLMSGIIDVFLNVPSNTYLGMQPFPAAMKGVEMSSGFVYEYNLNQMSDSLRSELGGGFNYGSNNQLLLDPVVRTAFAMSVDKQAIVDNVLNGLGSPADSLVPDVNPWHYTYGSIPGEVPITFDPMGARALLYENGWQYRSLADGAVHIEYGSADYYTYYPLCQLGGTSELSFRFATPSEAVEWDQAARMLASWAAIAGIDLWSQYRLVSTNEMNSMWYSADYDVWLWDWIMSVYGDPSTEILSVMTTQAIGGWSDVFYSDPVYDDLYAQSLRETDPVARRVLTDDLQRIAYESMTCQCLAYAKSLHITSSLGPEHWQNFGDWAAQPLLSPEMGRSYLYMRVYPADNPPPVVSTSSMVETGVGQLTSFTGSAMDSSPLVYMWIFGDGQRSSWAWSPTASNNYIKSGIYTAYLLAKELSTDEFIGKAKVTVRVVDLENRAPTNATFAYTPTAPSAGSMIILTGSATDFESDPLTFTWTFGDGLSGTGQTVTHRFDTAGTYTVTMYVTDGVIGIEPRPVWVAKLIYVATNSAPTLSVPDFPNLVKRIAYTFTVTASDPDVGDTLTFTWDWGDGSTSMTNANSATHVYARKGVYTLTVTVSDGTGSPGHTVFDTGIVNVLAKLPRVTYV